MSEEFRIRSSDGTGLAAYRWRARVSKATIVLIHGYCDHAGRYPELVEAAVARGYSVAAVDLRGHGRSEGRQGHTLAMGSYLDDIEALVRAVEADAGPMFLVAHSMGGLASIRYLQSGRHGAFAGVVFSSPYLGLALELPLWKKAAGHLMSRLWPSFAIPTGIPLAELSRNPEAVQRTESDKLYGRNATARTFTEQLQAHRDAFEQAAKLTLPSLFLVAGSDTIAKPEATKRFYELVGSADKRLEILAPMYHEIFADPDREALWGILFPWLEAHLPRQAQASR